MIPAEHVLGVVGLQEAVTDHVAEDSFSHRLLKALQEPAGEAGGFVEAEAGFRIDRILTVRGAQDHNLKAIDVHFPLGTFITVTGVSGSGKSTLVTETLYHALARHSYRSRLVAGKHAGIDGLVKIEMHFLADVYVPCDVCRGRRYKREALDVFYKGRNIADILDMTVNEALEFFDAVPRIRAKLQTLHDVGLGYVHLGQSATTLSGGEAQRVKLADRVIDLGPGGGEAGGGIVVEGTPEAILAEPSSYTGQHLTSLLG